MSRTLKAHLLLIFITVVWGATFVVIKNALDYISPLLYNTLRFSLAALILLVIYRAHLGGITRGALRMGTLVGVFLWLGYEFQTAGLKLTTPSKSAFLTAMFVVLVPVFLAIGWRRRLSRWTMAGVTLAFVGLYLLSVPGGSSVFGLGDINRGDVLTMFCAVAFALQIIVLGRAMQSYRFEHIVVVQVGACAVLMALTVPVVERAYVVWTPAVLWAIAITAVLGTALAFAAQAWAQKFTPPTHTALIFSLEPVFAGLTSYVVLGERLGWRGGTGAALILAGVLLSELKGSPEKPQEELGMAD